MFCDFFKGVTSSDWFQTIGTILAVVIAFYIEKIYVWIARPKLKIEIKLKPPHCNISRYTANDMGDIYLSTLYHFRFTITNIGKTTAKEIEVTISDWFYKKDDKWVYREDFLAGNLFWILSNEHYMPYIFPKTSKEVYLGQLKQPKDMTTQKALFVVKMFDNYDFDLHTLEAKFKVSIGGENCKSISQTFILKYDGLYDTDEAIMFKNHISIKKI